MNFSEYQQLAARTIPDGLNEEGLYLNAVLGINGEAGEMADMLKKQRFQGHSYTTEQVLNEIGDVLWYLAAACTALGVSLGAVAEQNIAKLQRRYPDGFSTEASISRLDTACDLDEEHNVYPQVGEGLSLNDSEWWEEATAYRLHDYTSGMEG